MKKKIVIPAAVVLLLLAAVFIYVNDYYHSEVTVQEYANGENVAVSEFEHGLFLDGKGDLDALIFYPGAKVEYTSYLPLFYKLAEQGVDCFLVEMPCNLAMFGMKKAGEIMEEYGYENWYLSGHSLGGAMAASYTAEHLEEIDGIVLLASYPTTSLDRENFSVVSLYGSEDMVLNMENLEEGRKFMPENYTEICIEGGNHAWFGNYGEQEGDGAATITKEEQQEQTVDAIIEMVRKKAVVINM